MQANYRINQEPSHPALLQNNQNTNRDQMVQQAILQF